MDPKRETHVRGMLDSKTKAAADARTAADAGRVKAEKAPNPDKPRPCEQMIHRTLQEFAIVLREQGWRAFVDHPTQLSVKVCRDGRTEEASISFDLPGERDLPSSVRIVHRGYGFGLDPSCPTKDINSEKVEAYVQKFLESISISTP
jgi:hypothetical protein